MTQEPTFRQLPGGLLLNVITDDANSKLLRLVPSR